jgi:hypothetical protein
MSRLSFVPFVPIMVSVYCHHAHAIRPFVTDDARVVGEGLAQVETWIQGDRHELAHNVLGAIGPTDWLELTAGFTHGGLYGAGGGYGISGPILQLKTLWREAKSGDWPGVAFAAGTLTPFGHGAFTPPGVATFGYLALTQSLLEEDLLLHANVGMTADERTPWVFAPTGGFGFQARVIGRMHAVAEVFHGDPYDPLFARTATQAGFRYILTEAIQFDGTIGASLNGGSASWWSLGVRLVSDSLW